jgi:hypothetical protein
MHYLRTRITEKLERKLRIIPCVGYNVVGISRIIFFVVYVALLVLLT